MRPVTPRMKAFTLLELLVAAAIVGMIVSGLAVSLHVAFKARRSTTEGLATVRAARGALDAVGHDLQLALPPTGVLAGAFTSVEGYDSQSHKADTVSFYNTADPARNVDGAGDIEEITFAVMTEADLQAASTTGNTTAALLTPNSSNAALPVLPPSSDDSNDGILVRRVSRRLLAPIGEATDDQIICRHVRSFAVRLYDGSQWVASWDSTAQENMLPVAIEVTLEIAPSGSGNASANNLAAAMPSYKLARVIRPFCAQSSNVANNAGAGGAVTP